jgi:hypothetical protein
MGEHKLPKLKLFLALPNYGHQRWNLLPIIRAPGGGFSGFHEVVAEELSSSLLANGFNTLWARALAERKHGLTHFLLLHSDVVPWDDDWLSQLYQEMVRVGAQVLSAVVPLKDLRGVTSTAIDGTPLRSLRRFTMKEIMAQPDTFTHPDLLVNTGMLLVDLREDWVEQIYFTIKDAIIKAADGSYTTLAESEDWNFSRQVRRLGVRLWATRKVRLTHVGEVPFKNFTVWGTEPHDLEAEAKGCDMSPLVTSGPPEPLRLGGRETPSPLVERVSQAGRSS